MKTAVPAHVFLDTGDMYRIRNDWTPQFKGKTRTGSDLVIDPLDHRGKGWVIQPGKSALVPFQVIQIWWGDPRSKPQRYEKFADSKETGYVDKREEIIRRLGVLYGSYAADVNTLLAPEWPRGHDEYGQDTKVVPHPVSIQTEDGTTVIPACFDRSGEQIFGTVNTETEDLNDEVAYRNYLERQLADVKARLDSLAPDAEVDSAKG